MLYAAAILLALAARLVFLRVADLSLESDEAIVGLMARHILFRGDWPTFYYGQNYLGPLEPATSALFMALLGPTTFALRLGPLAYSLVFVGFTVAFARRAFGPVAATFTTVYLAFPPLFLLTWSVKARGGYAELLGLGALILWLTLELADQPRQRSWRWFALGGLSGLALWTDPLAVVYLLPAAAYLVLRVRQGLLRWTALAALGSAILTSYPMLRANLQSGDATLRDLTSANASQPLTFALFRHNLSAVAQTSFPVLLGFLQATSNVPEFDLAARAHHLVATLGAAIGVVLVLALIGLGIGAIPRLLRLDPQPLDLLVWVGVLSIALSAASQVESVHLTEPRYLLPLYSLVPLGAKGMERLGRFPAMFAQGRNRTAPSFASSPGQTSWETTSARPAPSLLALSTVICVAVLALNARSWLHYQPTLAAPVLSGQVVRADAPGLSEVLIERGDRTIYADYWIVYSVAFVSDEQVVGGVIDDNLRVGFNRYIPFAIAADQSASPAVVVVKGSPAEANLRSWLERHSARYEMTSSGNLRIFDRIAPRFEPVKGRSR